MLLRVWLSLVIAVYAQINTLRLVQNESFLGNLSNKLNEDVVSKVIGYLNPRIYSLAETAAIFPASERMETERYSSYDGYWIEHVYEHDESVDKPLPSGSLFTIHVAGDDRKLEVSTIMAMAVE